MIASRKQRSLSACLRQSCSTLDLASTVGTRSQLGLSAGIGPTWGQAWPTLNIEHRLYVGKIQALTHRRNWFFRQGGTWFPAGKEGAASLSLGIDLKSKHSNRGWTIDAGAFILFRNRRDYTNQLYPALRFQYYGYFKKSSHH